MRDREISVPERDQVSLCGDHETKEEGVCEYVFPDGRCYFSATIISLVFTILASWTFLSICSGSFDMTKAFELLKISSLGILFVLLRSCCPEAYFVLMRKRAFFYFSFDSIWAVKREKGDNYQNCAARLPKKVFCGKMFSHRLTGASVSWNWVRGMFFALDIEALLMNLCCIIRLVNLKDKILIPSSWLVAIVLMNSVGMMICLTCILFRKKNFLFLPWRKLHRIF